jgi:hypothetical protein
MDTTTISLLIIVIREEKQLMVAAHQLWSSVPFDGIEVRKAILKRG